MTRLSLVDRRVLLILRAAARAVVPEPLVFASGSIACQARATIERQLSTPLLRAGAARVAAAEVEREATAVAINLEHHQVDPVASLAVLVRQSALKDQVT